MKKTPLLLIGLILLPVLILGWISVQLEKNQQELVKHQFEGLVQLQLEDVDDLLQSHFQRLENALQEEARLLLASKDREYNPSTLRNLVKTSPYIDHLFILDPQNRTLFPVIDNATQHELLFLQQTQTLLSTQSLFARTQEHQPGLATNTISNAQQISKSSSNIAAEVISPAPYNAQLKQKVNSAPLLLSSKRAQPYSANPQPSPRDEPEVVAKAKAEAEAELASSELAPSDLVASDAYFDTAASENTTTDELSDSRITTERWADKTKTNIRNKLKVSDAGWIAWYNNTQLQHIYWQTTPDNEVIGFAINSARLLSDLINLLPDQSQVDQSDSLKNAGIYLKNSRGDISYEWGNIELTPDNFKPLKTINLSHPLGSWRLEYISPTLTPPRDNWLEKLLILLVTFSTLSLLGWLIYREQTRESRLARQRVNFVNQVSHELKTPLTNVRMYAEMLENQLDENQLKPKRYLGVINNESQRLSRLIDNVLSFSRLERDSVELSLQKGTVGACIQNTLQAFAPALAQRGLEPNFHDQCNASVMIDQHCTEQILNNLLSNIEKYAANSGEIKIECWYEHDRSYIRVHDNGPGIDSAVSDVIFDQFYRVSNKLTDGVTGTGIGLSIARELARKHGGDLILESSACGACFLLTLHTPAVKSSSLPQNNKD